MGVLNGITGASTAISLRVPSASFCHGEWQKSAAYNPKRTIQPHMLVFQFLTSASRNSLERLPLCMLTQPQLSCYIEPDSCVSQLSPWIYITSEGYICLSFYVCFQSWAPCWMKISGQCAAVSHYEFFLGISGVSLCLLLQKTMKPDPCWLQATVSWRKESSCSFHIPSL